MFFYLFSGDRLQNQRLATAHEIFRTAEAKLEQLEPIKEIFGGSIGSRVADVIALVCGDITREHDAALRESLGLNTALEDDVFNALATDPIKRGLVQYPQLRPHFKEGLQMIISGYCMRYAVIKDLSARFIASGTTNDYYTLCLGVYFQYIFESYEKKCGAKLERKAGIP